MFAHRNLIQRPEAGEALPNGVVDLPVEPDQVIVRITLGTVGTATDEPAADAAEDSAGTWARSAREEAGPR